jgi:hypothetical protein
MTKIELANKGEKGREDKSGFWGDGEGEDEGGDRKRRNRDDTNYLITAVSKGNKQQGCLAKCLSATFSRDSDPRKKNRDGLFSVVFWQWKG